MLKMAICACTNKYPIHTGWLKKKSNNPYSTKISYIMLFLNDAIFCKLYSPHIKLCTLMA